MKIFIAGFCSESTIECCHPSLGVTKTTVVKNLRLEKLRPSVSSTDSDRTACSNIVFPFVLNSYFVCPILLHKIRFVKSTNRHQSSVVKWPVVTGLSEPSNFFESINSTKLICFWFVLLVSVVAT